jgi:hypothetical protein
MSIENDVDVGVSKATEMPEDFGSDPPSKFATYLQMLLIVAYYVGLDVAVFALIYIKGVKDNWPLFKCSPIYMMTASFFGYDTETNFQQCIQSMQTGYMSILMEPANYIMSVASGAIGGITDALNDVREFMDTFRSKLTGGIQNIFGVFLNMLVQIQVMVIKMKDMMSKNIGIMTTLMYTMDTSVQTMENTWAGPIGKVVRAL